MLDMGQTGRTATDAIAQPSPDATRLRGLLGGRIDACRENRLNPHDDDYLLWPFAQHIPLTPVDRPTYLPGDAPRPDITQGDWHGEFIGNWVAAATTLAVNASDLTLAAKVNLLVEGWVGLQDADGYLGTYDPADRWKAWDVWVQANDLIGLLTHHQLTGVSTSLEAARRVADRVLADFGPGKRSLVATGFHRGMNSSALLGPLVVLHRLTGSPRYLQFARWLVDEDWEEPHGPRILSSLKSHGNVDALPHKKAIELIIVLLGLLELYRTDGAVRYLSPALIAWEDIADRFLYITGSASAAEVLDGSFLPNTGLYCVGETCVTSGWIELSITLGRLTGQARFFDSAEQAIYNHLLAAQSEDGRGWAYYVGLRDVKRYRQHTDPECCPTRGTRALSLLPSAAVGFDHEGVVINLFEAASSLIPLGDGLKVAVRIETDYPFDGHIKVNVDPSVPSTFTLRLRKPAWCGAWTLSIDGSPCNPAIDQRGYVALTRVWSGSTSVDFVLEMLPRTMVDVLGNRGHVAFARGPLIYAADGSLLPQGWNLDDLTVQFPARDKSTAHEGHAPSSDIPRLVVKSLGMSAGCFGPSQDATASGPGRSRYRAIVDATNEPSSTEIDLVPFFLAGNQDPDSYRSGVWPADEVVRRETYQVWLPAAVPTHQTS